MIDIPATSSTPRIFYRPEGRTLSFVGESYPENSFEFFAPVFEWLGSSLEGLQELRVEINVPYMNSSSTKCMLDILDVLEEAASRGVRIVIVWFYEADNDRSLDLAKEFQEDVELPFELSPIGGAGA